jgi:hypothetical protein
LGSDPGQALNIGGYFSADTSDFPSIAADPNYYWNEVKALRWSILVGSSEKMVPEQNPML